tara:strand:+ start:10343 stop:10861 length:519 start_codon:yes stop_codon:yes gene_type:complete
MNKEILNVELSKLVPYEKNSRTHTQEQIEQIASSIQEFGFTNPVLIDENNSVLAGHGRVKAAELLELNDVPTLKVTGLSDKQKRAYVIADNKLALNATWNDDILQTELQDLFNSDFDLSILGLNENEINSFLGDSLNDISDEKDFVGAEEITLDDIDNFAHECPRCGFNFND